MLCPCSKILLPSSTVFPKIATVSGAFVIQESVIWIGFVIYIQLKRPYLRWLPFLMCPIGNTLVPQKSLSKGPQIVRGDAFLQAPLLKFLNEPVLCVRLSQLFIFVCIHLQGIYCKLSQKVFKLKLKRRRSELTFSESLCHHNSNRVLLSMMG